MTVRTNWYTMDNKLGVNLNKLVTSVSITANPLTPEYPGVPHNLGDRVQSNGGGEWVFVQATATVTAFSTIAIYPGYKAAILTSSNVSTTADPTMYGIAQWQVPTSVSVGGTSYGATAQPGDFFWALVKADNGIKILTQDSAMPGSAGILLFAGSTAGWVATSSADGPQLNGLVAIGSATDANTNAVAEVGMFTYISPFPRIRGLTA